MKFKIDENLPAEICADLHGLGHDAETVPDEGLSGSRTRLYSNVFSTKSESFSHGLPNVALIWKAPLY